MMQSKMKTACLMTGALLAAVPGVAGAETSQEQLHAKVAQLEAKLAQLEAGQQGDWMSDARRAEIEGMIADVFADANNRATLLQEGALAGIDEKGKIFLLSADGSFSANFNGQIQFRYILNNQGNRADETVSGFQTRRVKFGAKGKVGDGWSYALKFDTNRANRNTGTEDAYITKKVNDNLSVTAGVKKLPFARQELISSSRQVAVDRALATEFFTLGRSDLIEGKYKLSDDVVFTGAISDGANANFSEYNADASNDFAVTGRIDWQVVGDNWKAAKHEFGGVDEDALFLGGAVHYEKASGSGAPDNGLAWTVDALYKTGALGLSAAVFGNSTENIGGTDTDQFGGYLQASLDLDNDWDVFGRWDYIDGDGNSGIVDDQLQAVTFGVNKHFNKNVKFTGDIVYVYSGNDPVADGNTSTDGQDSSGMGLSGGFSDDEDTIALRLQLQLVF